MRTHIHTTLVTTGLLVCSLLTTWVPEAHGQGLIEDRTKLAQTGMQFLAVSVDARAAALGDAMTAQEASSVALFYNPASMARMGSSIHVSLGQTQWFADINYNIASAAFRPSDGRYGTVGFSIMSVDYGELLGTIRADNNQGFIDTGTFSPTAMAAGLGYAYALSGRFSVGGQVKYVRQSLGPSVMGFDEAGNRIVQDNAVGTVAFDFGALYRTGFRSLTFGVSARNFSRQITYAEENFELPLTLRIGVSMDVLDFTGVDQETHSFLISADAMHPRDYVEQGRIGGEYVFMNTFALRAGYVYPSDEQGISLGLGVQQSIGKVGLSLDYAYTRFGVLGNVNRFSLQLSFN